MAGYYAQSSAKNNSAVHRQERRANSPNRQGMYSDREYNNYHHRQQRNFDGQYDNRQQRRHSDGQDNYHHRQGANQQRYHTDRYTGDHRPRHDNYRPQNGRNQPQYHADRRMGNSRPQNDDTMQLDTFNGSHLKLKKQYQRPAHKVNDQDRVSKPQHHQKQSKPIKWTPENIAKANRVFTPKYGMGSGDEYGFQRMDKWIDPCPERRMEDVSRDLVSQDTIQDVEMVDVF